MISPYHPMGDGLVESFNGLLKQMLRRLYMYRTTKRMEQTN